MQASNVDQLITVNIQLEASELAANYEQAIYQRVLDKYGDACYLNGFIYGKSIALTKISNGYKKGSHLKGSLTFNVSFKATLCVPKIGVLVKALIKSITKMGIIASAFPMELIVPRQIQQYHNIDLLAGLQVGDYVYIKTLDYSIKEDHLNVIGFLEQLVIEKPHMIELARDALSFKEYVVGDLLTSSQAPAPQDLLGDYQVLRQTKQLLEPKKTIWDDIVHDLVNPYALVSKQRSHCVLSQGYAILWEICQQMTLLDKFKDQAMTIACLAEGPGGFMQCLIELRKRLDDQYHAITLKDPTNSNFGSGWNNVNSYNYFAAENNKRDEKKQIQQMDGDLLKEKDMMAFIKTVGAGSCQLVTADGFATGDVEAEAHLLLAEMVTALTLQAIGGTLIIRIGEIYYDLILQIIQMLWIYYPQLILIKPYATDPSTDTKYLVCQGFGGISSDQLEELRGLLARWEQVSADKHVHLLVSMVDDPKSDFFNGLVSFNDFTASLQIEKITEGLNLLSANEYKKDKVLAVITDKQKDHLKVWSETYHWPPKKTLFRLLTPNYPQIGWYQGLRNDFDFDRCHWGQLKLFYTELEFLTLVNQQMPLNQCVLVYVGAAPGHHTVFLRKLFPELEMILYDPKPFVKELFEDKGVEIHTGEVKPGEGEGYFTDDKIKDVLANPRVQGKKILLISDIRASIEDEVEFEKGVFDNMIWQQRLDHFTTQLYGDVKTPFSIHPSDNFRKKT